jgi:hypothetical protein
MAISRLNLGTTNQVLVKAAAGQTSNLLELQNSSGTVVAGLNQDGVWSGTAEPGLVLLNTTSFSAVASQSINDVFSTTYDAYRIILSCSSASANDSLRLRMRVSGADNTSNNYYFSLGIIGFAAAPSLTAQSGGGLTSSFSVGWNNAGSGGETDFMVYSPFKTTRTHFSRIASTNPDNDCASFGGGNTSVTTSYTGFTIYPNSGTMTGTVSVYGVNK